MHYFNVTIKAYAASIKPVECAASVAAPDAITAVEAVKAQLIEHLENFTRIKIDPALAFDGAEIRVTQPTEVKIINLNWG